MSVGTYQPGASGKDTYLAAETNFGSSETLLMNTSSIGRILLQFDISDIPATATCTDAVLSLWASAGTGGDTWTVYPIKSGNSGWTEDGATWNTKDGSGAWAGSAGCSTSGTDYDGTAIGSHLMPTNNNEQQISLTTSVVQTWFGASNSNYGILLRTDASTNTLYIFASDSSAEPTKRPKLVVTYSTGIVSRRTFSVTGTRVGSRQEPK